MKAHWRKPLLCFTAYVCAYFGRMNLSAAIPLIQAETGYSKAELGLVAGGFFGCYAVGQLINGVLGDRFSPRVMVALGLAVSGGCNLLVCLCGSLPLFVALWSVNGYFQSMLWGPIVRTVSIYTPEEHRNRAAFLLSTSMPVGYLLSYLAMSRLSASQNWRFAFLLPGVLLLMIAVFWIFGLRDFSTAIQQSDRNAVTSAEASPPGKMAAFVFRNGLWLVALLCVIQGTVKEGVSLWGPALLSETLGIPMDRALILMAAVPVLNFVSLLFSVRVNRAFGYREKRTIIAFFGLSSVAALCLFLMARSGLPWTFPALACLSAALFAANNMLVVFIPMNFHREGRVSSAAGFIDSAIYLGAAVAGPLLGSAADQSGWTGVTAYWLAGCLAATIAACLCRDYKKGV